MKKKVSEIKSILDFGVSRGFFRMMTVPVVLLHESGLCVIKIKSHKQIYCKEISVFSDVSFIKHA